MRFAACAMFGLLLISQGARAGETLDHVRKTGVVSCGVVADEDDYSEADTHGDLSAMGRDYCRAMAAGILGDAGRAMVFTLPDEPDAMAALQAGKVDVVFGVTPNPVLGGLRRISFGPPLMMDGQGFLVNRRLGVYALADLGGRNVCFINNSPAERTLYDGLEPLLATPEHRFPYSERGEMVLALMGGHCDAITGDISWMANVQAGFQARAGEFEVLAATISTDPFSPAYRSGDRQWGALVDWMVWGLMQAEVHGVGRTSVAGRAHDPDVVVRRLVGAEPWIGRALGVSDTVFARAIGAAGNAGEIYERDVGAESRLRLPRGRSAPVEKGGVLWALPVAPME